MQLLDSTETLDDLMDPYRVARWPRPTRSCWVMANMVGALAGTASAQVELTVYTPPPGIVYGSLTAMTPDGSSAVGSPGSSGVRSLAPPVACCSSTSGILASPAGERRQHLDDRPGRHGVGPGRGEAVDEHRADG